MNRLLALIPLLFLIPACTALHAQNPTPTPDSPETGCLYYANLVDHLELRMAGLAEPWEHPPIAYIRWFRDVHFADNSRLKYAAETLHNQLFLAERQGAFLPFNPWQAVSAARQIDRLCAANGHRIATNSPDVIVEYTCLLNWQVLRCGTREIIQHDHGYIPWDHEHN